MFPAKLSDFTHNLQKAQVREESHSKSLLMQFFCLSWHQLMICLYHTFNAHWGKEDGKHTWFLKERCRTGSSAAKEMLLSKMKNRIRLVKMLSLTIRWQWTRNLQERGEAQLYLSENSQTWETLPPPLLPAGLAPEDCSSEQLPFAPAAGRMMGPRQLCLTLFDGQPWLSTSCIDDGQEVISCLQDSSFVHLNGQQSLPPDRAFGDLDVVWNLPTQNYTPCFHSKNNSPFI